MFRSTPPDPTPAIPSPFQQLQALITAQAAAGPSKPTTALATVTDDDPLTIALPDGSTVPATRHAGYTPVVGQSVQADYLDGGWVISDEVVGQAGA